MQSVGESDAGFIARLREESRFCDFKKFETITNPERLFIKENLSHDWGTWRNNTRR